MVEERDHYIEKIKREFTTEIEASNTEVSNKLQSQLETLQHEVARLNSLLQKKEAENLELQQNNDDLMVGA